MNEIASPNWQRSRACSGGNCVEVAESAGHILIRDSKAPANQPLSFTRDEWTAFVRGVENGEFRF